MKYQGVLSTVQARTVEGRGAPVFRLRPMAPRGLRTAAGSLEAMIFWNTPADMRGVAGFRIYRDNESNLVYETKDPSTRQATIRLPGASSAMCFVCSVSEIGRESPKISITVRSNTDKLLQTGNSGETSGSSPVSPPEWPNEPSGGSYRRIYRTPL